MWTKVDGISETEKRSRPKSRNLDLLDGCRCDEHMASREIYGIQARVPLDCGISSVEPD